MTDTLEVAPDTIETVIAALEFNNDGLVPVIAQQHDTGEVLMMAWMNSDAVRETLTSAHVCYWSRSRQTLWKKGETSGQIQMLVDFRWDCDGDTILALVNQQGVACHTGRKNCFFNAVRADSVSIIADVEKDPDELYGQD